MKAKYAQIESWENNDSLKNGTNKDAPQYTIHKSFRVVASFVSPSNHRA
jgi:hypothetical protein